MLSEKTRVFNLLQVFNFFYIFSHIFIVLLCQKMFLLVECGLNAKRIRLRLCQTIQQNLIFNEEKQKDLGK